MESPGGSVWIVRLVGSLTLDCSFLSEGLLDGTCVPGFFPGHGDYAKPFVLHRDCIHKAYGWTLN